MPKLPDYDLKSLPNCTRCKRLVACRNSIREHPAKGFTSADYWSKPVPGFGDFPGAQLLILGLAPGAHGANRSGRPFTGDAAGEWLYPTLYKFGFSNQPRSVSRDDKLKLKGAYITNAVKCVPPGNKPTPQEADTCEPYLTLELQKMKQLKVIIALGGISLRTYSRWAVGHGLLRSAGAIKFSHGGEHVLPNRHHLLMSYHCSRLNTNTKRLTLPMFESVFKRAQEIIQKSTTEFESRPSVRTGGQMVK